MESRGIGTIALISIVIVIAIVAVIGGYYLGTHSGGNDGGGNTVTIKQITQNPNAYENHQVIVIAKVTAVMGMGSAVDDDGFFITLRNLPSNFIANGEKYKIVGKVVYTQDINLITYTWAIDVSDISKI